MEEVISLVDVENKVRNKIYRIRQKKVMLDFDLADLYQVETKRINEAVRRNILRFPEDFMFQLNKEEFEGLRSQIATSNLGRGGRRYATFVFTELGVAMLSSVLKSERAILVNIQIMRTFSKIREMLLSHKDLKEKIEELEHKYDKRFTIVFRALDKMIEDERKTKERLGFRTTLE